MEPFWFFRLRRAYDSAYDSERKEGRKRSYNYSDYDSDSVASENQP